MQVNCNNCPHLNKEILSKLISIEQSNNNFEKFKCMQCKENKELWICLICGDSFCSQNMKEHTT